MNKRNKLIIVIVAIILIIMAGLGEADKTVNEGVSNIENNIENDETKKLEEEKKAKEDEEKLAKEEEARKAEELRKAEEAKKEQERLEEERIQREAEIVEAKRIEAERIEAERVEAERIAEEQRQQEIAASNDFYVNDGVANHDSSTGYDSPYSDPNEPVITEEYGYITSGNSYIHKTPNCKFIRGEATTCVPTSSTGKPSCNCWYY